MYVYNTENMDEDIVNKILSDGLAVDIRGDKDFLLSKENKIVINDVSISYNDTLEAYVEYMYDDGDYVDLHFLQIGKNEAIGVLVDALYKKDGKTGNISYAERIYKSESPNNEILDIIDECVLIELENRLKIFRKSINAFKKQVQTEGIKWQ